MDIFCAGSGRARNALDEGTPMPSGTLTACGGIWPSRRFEYELAVPLLGRRIVNGYDVHELPVRR
jgi:hypothetical protein